MTNVVLKLGDDVSTDIIFPGRFIATVLPTETPQYAFADTGDINARLRAGEIPVGSFIVAGKNFGCGSSREQAASCLKGHELVILAHDFARIFFQNAINLGLNVTICPEIEVQLGDELELTSAEAGAAPRVVNKTSGKSFAVAPLPKSRQAIIDAGGLIPYTRQRLLQK